MGLKDVSLMELMEELSSRGLTGEGRISFTRGDVTVMLQKGSDAIFDDATFKVGKRYSTKSGDAIIKYKIEDDGLVGGYVVEGGKIAPVIWDTHTGDAVSLPRCTCSESFSYRDSMRLIDDIS